MQKFLKLLCVPGLACGFALSTPAQSKSSSNMQDTLMTKDNTTSVITAEAKQPADTTACIELSPVLAVRDVTNGSSARYTLLSPLAGSLLPENFISDNLNNYVVGYIKTYFLDNSNHLQAIQSRGQTYFNLIENVFQRFGVPEELKYLAVIESGLNTNATSRVGAAGPWQFMASTARILGLTVNKSRDDRRDFYKSTVAAAKYLNTLHDMLDNWLLVVAAYNCGPGGVQSAITRSGSSNFWDLEKYLPSESRKHVMKFIATAYILDRFANFFGVDRSDLAQSFANHAASSPTSGVSNAYASLATLPISGKYSMSVIAKYLSMDISELNKMNPGFEQMMSTANNTYSLRLPPDKMIIFKDKRSNILNESVQLLMENNRQLSSAAYPKAQALPVSQKSYKKS